MRTILGLDVDPEPIQLLAEAEPRLRATATALRGMRPPRFPTLFEAFANVVPFQQVLRLRFLPPDARHHEAPHAARATPYVQRPRGRCPSERLRHVRPFERVRARVHIGWTQSHGARSKSRG
ncbi:MAG TPA: hypothetical protein VM580_20230 [Labilithrix sp.]|nr:hypothetical protein [Labilithrix sp.]